MTRQPPTSPLFPYTTLFRSRTPPDPHPGRPDPRKAGEEVDVLPPQRSADREDQERHLADALRRRDGGRSASRRSDRKSTRLNSSHLVISYAVFCLKKKKTHH